MEPVHLFALMRSQRDWLSTRQSLVAQNIANIDTPGYRALDVAPFARVLEKAGLEKTGFEMAASSAGHLRTAPADAIAADVRPAEGWESTHSGNTVSAEAEMIRVGDIRTAYTLGANITRAFHTMWMATAK
jgi:flagellar basal-body rod protein FlgB